MQQPSGHEQNADQIAYWNGPSGQRWADRHAAQLALLFAVQVVKGHGVVTLAVS